MRAAKEELSKEQEAHRDTKQKLSLVEKEAKSSNLMSMELEDYQRSIQALEGELASKRNALELAQKEKQIQVETLQHMRKDAGKEKAKIIFCKVVIFFNFRIADSAAFSERGDSSQTEAAAGEEQEGAGGGEEEGGGAAGSHC